MNQLPDWLGSITLGQIILIIVLIGGIWSVIHKIWPTLRGLSRFLDDYNGRPPDHPGFMERLDNLEQDRTAVVTIKESLDGIKGRLDQIEKAMKSFLDAVTESNADRKSLHDAIEHLEDRLDGK